MIEIGATLLGLLSYHFMVMAELHNEKGKVVWFGEYFQLRPFKSLLSVTGAILGYFLAGATLPPETTESLRILAYAGAGYAPYHVFDYLSQKQAKVAKPEIVEFEKQEKFRASDVTTWIKRK